MDKVMEQIRSAGVVGAGGAGFPTHIKLKSAAKADTAVSTDTVLTDTILINGTECEPLLKTDFHLLKTYRNILEDTLRKLCEYTGAKTGIIGIKSHTGKLLGISDGQCAGEKAQYRLTGDIYPAGDEIVLIKETAGKTVPAGNLPISAGVVVLNVETLLNIAGALENIPVTEKFLTVGGDTAKTYVLKTEIGTPVSDIFYNLGVKIPPGSIVLDGGPMMGNIINPDTAAVTKTTKGLLIIDKNTLCARQKTANISSVFTRASAACCGCRMCTDMCPRYLMGYPIEPHRILAVLPNKTEAGKTFMGSFYCSNCGVCETVACCQNISPNKLFARVKNTLIKNGVKAAVHAVSTPRELRDYRKIPVSRVINRLGIRKYVKEDYEFTEIPPAQQLKLLLKQHAGAPAESIVKQGANVKKGQLLARIKEGALGANIHSPIDGAVSSVNESCIIINS